MPRILISDDHLRAELHLEAGESLTVDAVRAQLAHAGVRVGILEPQLAAIATVVGPATFRVAEGQAPHKGQDGRIEYMFPTGRRDLAPVIDTHGQADFRNLGLITNVQLGQVLARRVPPDPAVPGVSVTGHPLNPGHVRDVQLRAGEGAALSPDGQMIVAARAGNPHLDRGVVVVRQEYSVPGSVSLSTGNIDFVGDLHIGGHVEIGMVVRTTGNIVIQGSVEGAQIVAGGSILLNGGVRHQAVLQAGGDIVANFIETSRLSAGGSVAVKGDLLHSETVAHGSLAVGGNLIGGTTDVGEEARVRFLGARLGTPTSMRIQVASPEEDALHEIQKERAQVHAMLAQISPKIREAYEALQNPNPSKPPPPVEAVNKLLDAANQLNDRDAVLAEREAEAMAARQAVKRGRLEVREICHPGVQIQIHNAHMKIANDYPPGVFLEEQGTIRLLALTA